MRIYEINTRVHCRSFDEITDEELREYASLGFDAIWLMGVWQISEGVRKFSKIVSEDFEGSPYAVPDYKYNRELGGKRSFAALVKRAHKAGLKVLVDFVSNHMALDSPWIDEDPALFIRSDARVRKQATSDYFLHKSGEVVAFGRDPFFPPWHDTSQLDYSNKALRSRMIKVLKEIAQAADGVRCDMAMLILRDYFHNQWYPLVPEDWFHDRWPEEFWSQAIREVKAERPDFTFIAEAYWDKETRLIEMGFDYAYEKRLYDALVARNAHSINHWLSKDLAEVGSRVYFIENHDEPRAAAVFDKKYNIAAAALILSLPGAALIHEGQLEGKRERLPVQRIKPLTNEPVDVELRDAYLQILKATTGKVFQTGALKVFDTSVYGVVSFMRQSQERVAAYIGQISDAWHLFHSAILNITALAQAVGATRQMHVTNLITGESVLVEEKQGAFLLRPNQFSAGDTLFCLLEATPD